MSQLTDSNFSDAHPHNPINDTNNIATKTKLDPSKQLKKPSLQRTASRYFTLSDSPVHSLIPRVAQNVLQNNLHAGILYLSDDDNFQNQHNCSILAANYTKKSESQSEPKAKHAIVLDQFIISYNSCSGDKTELKQQAKWLLTQMRLLGGLDGADPSKIDLKEAREGLARLSSIDEKEIKSESLMALQDILKKDPITENSAYGLMNVMISLLHKMDRNLQQTQTVSLQIEFAKTYGIISELLQRHYAKGYINAITPELKEQLTSSSKELARLNRQNNPSLTYHIDFALEGILRLKDDKRELIGILGRLYHVAIAFADIYLKDGQGMAEELEKALSDIDINITHDWYDRAIMMRILKQEVLKEKVELIDLLYVIKKNQSLGWNFFYEATNILTEIAIHGPTAKMRQMALAGTTSLGKKLPGLNKLAKYEKELPIFLWKPMLSLRAPKFKDPNSYVREVCLENLMKIAYEAQDKDIREASRKILVNRYQTDEKKLIKNLFATFMYEEKKFPQDERLFHAWIDETGKYAPSKITNEPIPAIINESSEELLTIKTSSEESNISLEIPKVVITSPKVHKVADHTIGQANHHDNKFLHEYSKKQTKTELI